MRRALLENLISLNKEIPEADVEFCFGVAMECGGWVDNFKEGDEVASRVLLNGVNSLISDCSRCPLRPAHARIAVPDGDYSADIFILMGQASELDSVTGVPLSGRTQVMSGPLLECPEDSNSEAWLNQCDEMESTIFDSDLSADRNGMRESWRPYLQKIGHAWRDRKPSVYVTSIVKCYSAEGYGPNELDACFKWAQFERMFSSASLTVAVGEVSIREVFGVSNDKVEKILEKGLVSLGYPWGMTLPLIKLSWKAIADARKSGK